MIAIAIGFDSYHGRTFSPWQAEFASRIQIRLVWPVLHARRAWTAVAAAAAMQVGLTFVGPANCKFVMDAEIVG